MPAVAVLPAQGVSGWFGKYGESSASTLKYGEVRVVIFKGGKRNDVD